MNFKFLIFSLHKNKETKINQIDLTLVSCFLCTGSLQFANAINKSFDDRRTLKLQILSRFHALCLLIKAVGDRPCAFLNSLLK